MLWTGLSPTFLLVGPQFERVDQVFTQTLRYRMRFGNLCLAGTVASISVIELVGKTVRECSLTCAF